ncbi:MAG: DNA starvation/stationary phase protection protein Dps [Devosia sp.]
MSKFQGGLSSILSAKILANKISGCLLQSKARPMHATHNTLSETIRAQSAGLLNLHLAAPIDLRGQVKQAHWNVSGPGFMAVHQLFDDVSGEVKTCSDMIAERAGGVGSTALGTVQVATERSFLVPYTLGVADVTEHIFAASATLAAFGQSIREAAAQATGSKDANTSDLSTEISRGIDRQLWFVESHAPAKTDVQAVQK